MVRILTSLIFPSPPRSFIVESPLWGRMTRTVESTLCHPDHYPHCFRRVQTSSTAHDTLTVLDYKNVRHVGRVTYNRLTIGTEVPTEPDGGGRGRQRKMTCWRERVTRGQCDRRKVQEPVHFEKDGGQTVRVTHETEDKWITIYLLVGFESQPFVDISK